MVSSSYKHWLLAKFSLSLIRSLACLQLQNWPTSLPVSLAHLLSMSELNTVTSISLTLEWQRAMSARGPVGEAPSLPLLFQKPINTPTASLPLQLREGGEGNSWMFQPARPGASDGKTCRMKLLRFPRAVDVISYWDLIFGGNIYFMNLQIKTFYTKKPKAYIHDIHRNKSKHQNMYIKKLLLEDR